VLSGPPCYFLRKFADRETAVLRSFADITFHHSESYQFKGSGSAQIRRSMIIRIHSLAHIMENISISHPSSNSSTSSYSIAPSKLKSLIHFLLPKCRMLFLFLFYRMRRLKTRIRLPVAQHPLVRNLKTIASFPHLARHLAMLTHYE
jgi:hypothetical protein